MWPLVFILFLALLLNVAFFGAAGGGVCWGLFWWVYVVSSSELLYVGSRLVISSKVDYVCGLFWFARVDIDFYSYGVCWFE